jgi:hypothetical protein
MSHLQGKTFFLFFSRDLWKRKRTSAKVRGISNDANQEGKEKWNKEPHRPLPSVSSRSRRKIDAAGIQIWMLEIVYTHTYKKLPISFPLPPGAHSKQEADIWRWEFHLSWLATLFNG